MATPTQEHSSYLKWFNVIASEAPVTTALPSDDYIQAIAVRDGLKFKDDPTLNSLPLSSTALQAALTALKA